MSNSIHSIDTVLDVTTIPPRERHPKIFELFDGLNAGEAFVLVNDHEPRPLYYQFLREREGKFTWDYLQEGPDVWKARIGKVDVTLSNAYHVEQDVTALMADIQPDSIVSRVFLKNDAVNMTLFGFDAGQELTEHTASKAAILQILKGEATLTLGDETVEAKANTWIYMPPNLPHSVVAKTQVVMLLTLLK